MPTIRRTDLENGGWIAHRGGDFYFDGDGGERHPHLHLRLLRDGAIDFMAFSDGQRGDYCTGNLITDGVITRRAQTILKGIPSNCGWGNRIWDEARWVMGRCE